MIEQTILGRLYQAFNPFQNTPAAGLPELNFIDLPVTLLTGNRLEDHAISFTKGGITYVFRYKHHSVNVNPNEIAMRFSMQAFDTDQQQVPVDIYRAFPYLADPARVMVQYDPQQLQLNDFVEFEDMPIGQVAVPGLTLAKFIGTRSMNGLLHALGFFMQFPFDALTCQYGQPLVLDAPIVTPATLTANELGEETSLADGTLTINVARGGADSGIIIETSLDGGQSWTANTFYNNLPAGSYVVLIRQQSRPRVYMPYYFSV